MEQNIHGTMNTARNYYSMFSYYLVRELKYKLNPYNECIANMMINYTKKGTSMLVTMKYLFLIQKNQDRICLSPDNTMNFHHVSTKPLFLSKQMQPDSQMAMSLLWTQITNTDMDNRKKLTKIMIYLQATWSLPLILHIDNFRNIQWCIDGTFTMHNNIKNNTGISMTIGRGPIYSSS